MVVKELSEITSLFRQATAFPALTDGNLVHQNETTLTIHSRWSQRDIERKEKITLQRSHILDLASGKVISQTDPQEVNNEVWNKVSPSGNYRAVVRSGKDKKNEDKQYLEIFDKTRKIKTVDVLALEKHGKIIGDDVQFGSLEWSSSEDRLLYAAEKKKPKSGSFFETKEKKGDGNEVGDEVSKGCEFEYRESWGEQMTERHHPVLCVMDWNSGVVIVMDCVQDSLSAGQAVWSPYDAGIVFCAWDHEPYRLGIKHCCQRKSGLYYLDMAKSSVECLSPEDRAVRFPRFSPDMSRLVYFDTPIGGAHHQCARLLMMDWATRSTKVVIDIVRKAPDSSFQGIFIASLPRNIWFEDNVHLSFSTAWRSITTAIIVNTNTGSVKWLAQGAATDNNRLPMSVLTVDKKSVLLSCSSLNIPVHLVVVHLKDLGNPDTAKWFHPDRTPESLDWLHSWEVLTHRPTQDRLSAINGNLDYESILCLPQKNKDGSLPPLVVFAHGGPHVGFDTAYNVITSFFCLCGYAVVMVNYRGSWGFGQDCIEALLGCVGDMDVKDVESCIQTMLSKGDVDGSRVAMFGGSHGGFLTTHLIGQYPKCFKAACTRNPVTNLVSMWSTSDIRDWIFVEGGFPYEMTSLADQTKLPDLWKRSPLSYVDQVKTPLLLLVGLEDKRCPPSQALEYYRALKARNLPVRCLTYPSSNHSLAEVDVEADCMVNTIVWFNTHML